MITFFVFILNHFFPYYNRFLVFVIIFLRQKVLKFRAKNQTKKQKHSSDFFGKEI